jgi:hypothetical protein
LWKTALRGNLAKEFTCGNGGPMLPRHLIQMRTTRHSSTRQPKRKKLVCTTSVSKTTSLLAAFYQRRKMGFAHSGAVDPAHVTTRLIPVRNGALNLNEYRFWRSGDNHKGFCRACQESFALPSERMKHQKEKGCTILLIEAYTLLLRDRKCVVCDNATTYTKWGIPLCNNSCVYRWQFEIGAGTYAISMAMKLHEHQQSRVTKQ